MWIVGRALQAYTKNHEPAQLDILEINANLYTPCIQLLHVHAFTVVWLNSCKVSGEILDPQRPDCVHQQRRQQIGLSVSEIYLPAN